MDPIDAILILGAIAAQALFILLMAMIALGVAALPVLAAIWAARVLLARWTEGPRLTPSGASGTGARLAFSPRHSS